MEALKHIGIKKSIRFVYFHFIQLLLAISFIPQIRVFLLRIFGAKIGKNTLIYNVNFMNLYRGSFSNLVVGDNCFIGNDVLLDLSGDTLW